MSGSKQECSQFRLKPNNKYKKAARRFKRHNLSRECNEHRDCPNDFIQSVEQLRLRSKSLHPVVTGNKKTNERERRRQKSEHWRNNNNESFYADKVLGAASIMRYNYYLNKWRAYLTKRNAKNKKVDELIKQEYKLSYSKAETLIHACEAYGNTEIPSEFIATTIFDNIGNRNARRRLNYRHRFLANKIQNYLDYDHMIGGRQFTNQGFRMADSNARYGVKFEKKEKSIVMIVFLNDRMKYFPIKTDQTFKSSSSQFYIKPTTDLKHILMFEKTFKTQPSIQVYLLGLNHLKEECEVLDQKVVELGIGAKVLLDEKDQQKFVIVYNEYVNENSDGSKSNRGFKSQLKVIQGQFTNTQLLIDENPMIVCDDVTCLQLSNQKLFGLCKSVGFDGEMKPRDELVYWTMDLTSDDGEKNVPVREFAFELVDRLVPRNFDKNTQYIWSKNECFVVARNSKEDFNLYSFNLLTKKSSLIFSKFLTSKQINLDENGNLMVQSNKGTYHFAVNKYLTSSQADWYKLRRKDLFSKNNNNKDLLAETLFKLPINSELRPFYTLLNHE